jgi:hypothetical protein
MIKSFFLENVATKAMALFLAVLTWTYLFIQGNATETIDLEFRPPELDREVFASAVYRDANRNVLLPGSTLQVRLSGPKGDVSALKVRAPKTYVCNVTVDPRQLTYEHGRLRIDLLDQAVFLGIPDSIRKEPLPDRSIWLEYVKYKRKEVKLSVPAAAWEGRPAAGYEVESVRVSQDQILVKIPADRADEVSEAEIGPVNVGGLDKPFVVERQELGAAAQGQNIVALQKFLVSVNIAPVKKTKTLTVDVTVSSKPENLPRIVLVTRSIKVGVRGPDELVDQIPEAALAAYVIVTDKDMEPAGRKNLNEAAIGCHIIDPKFQGKVTVVIMPDEKPENRQVTIEVKEKAK